MATTTKAKAPLRYTRENKPGAVSRIASRRRCSSILRRSLAAAFSAATTATSAGFGEAGEGADALAMVAPLMGAATRLELEQTKASACGCETFSYTLST